LGAPRGPARRFALGVVKGNPARSLYERHGFQIMSEDRCKIYMAKPPGA
jgi:ribosomal protein S18 acetylase RimI-like enzyme